MTNTDILLAHIHVTGPVTLRDAASYAQEQCLGITTNEDASRLISSLIQSGRVSQEDDGGKRWLTFEQ
jgi:hypothetical protein